MKPTVFLIPIEPLPERYSQSWYRNFPTAFTSAGLEDEDLFVIEGEPVSNRIKVGTFLDINATVQYKATQLQTIARMFEQKRVPQGSVFFFFDLEFWGIEVVRLLADMNKVSIGICGFLHAASYTVGDAFAIAEPYQRYTEVGWIAAVDKVFVGSHYHKSAVLSRRLRPLDADCLADRIIVTRNPLFLSDYETFIGVPKVKRVLMTNRPDPEKNPQQTLRLFEGLALNFPEWEFRMVTSRMHVHGSSEFMYRREVGLRRGWLSVKEGVSKEEYHRELQEASLVVTHSPEENYGYCVAEAILYKALPLMPRCASHLEFTTDPRLLFLPGSDYLWADRLLRDWGTDRWPECPHLDTHGAARIVEEVLSCPVR